MDDVRISVEPTTGLARRIRVEVAAVRVEREFEARLQAVARTANLKGFRPGKVAPAVIRQRLGARLRREVIGELVQSGYAEALKQERLRPVGEPRIDMDPDSGGKGSDLVFTASFEIYPEIAVRGLDDIAVTRPELVIDDADLQFVIDNLRRQRSTFRPADRPARDGDRVTLAWSARADGQATIVGSGDDTAIVLGAGALGRDLDEQMAGMRAGDVRTIRTILDGDLARPGLAGQPADITVRVLSVAEEHLPEVDDSFIRSFDLPSGSRDEFLQQIREYMRNEFEVRSTAEVNRQLFDCLLASNPIDVPKILVENEARDHGATAERRVRLSLLAAAIVRDQGLVVDRERVRARIDALASDQDRPDEFRKLYNQSPALLARIEGQVLDEQVAEWLTARATVTPLPTNFRSLKT